MLLLVLGFETKYSTLINETADYVLWKIKRRKQEYRRYMLSYLRPILLLISDFTNQDELVFMNSPEWLEHIKNRRFSFIPCRTDGSCLNDKRNSFQCEVEVLSAERIFEKYCVVVRDYDLIDAEEHLSFDQPDTLTIEIDV